MMLDALLAASLAVTHVTLIDGTGGPAISDATVVVEEGRIRAAGRWSAVRVPPGAEVVDGRGKHLVPGLWDLHVHLWYDEPFFPLYLAHGVTGVRDMGSDLGRIQRWRAEMAAGTSVGPRIVAAGYPLAGPGNTWPRSALVGVASAEDGTALFVASDGRGVSRVDLADGAVADVLTGGDATLAGIDGLSVHEGTLVGVVNALGRDRVVRFTLDAARERVAKAEVLEAAHAAFDVPTTGAVAGERLLLVANRQLRRLKEDGTIDDPARLKEVVILSVPLTAR
jgi:imidazolonepropionase-like amidohydrolase